VFHSSTGWSVTHRASTLRGLQCPSPKKAAGTFRPLARGLEAMPVAFDQQALTPCLPLHALQAWQAWATHRVSAFQRASSAVEGHNGALAPLHHNQRGGPKHRYKVWTVLHNFDCRAGDGTTPASRFFRRSFPDLFETALSHIEALPQPRRRKRQVALCH